MVKHNFMYTTFQVLTLLVFLSLSHSSKINKMGNSFDKKLHSATFLQIKTVLNSKQYTGISPPSDSPTKTPLTGNGLVVVPSSSNPTLSPNSTGTGTGNGLVASPGNSNPTLSNGPTTVQKTNPNSTELPTNLSVNSDFTNGRYKTVGFAADLTADKFRVNLYFVAIGFVLLLI